MRFSATYKTKQLFEFVAKLAIVFAAAAFIYYRISSDSQFNINIFLAETASYTSFSIFTIGILCCFTVLNFVAEIVKWRILVSHVQNISFIESTKQILGSFTASVWTPNRIGEYGAKILFFPKKFHKKIIGLNFLGNMSQLLATLLFGSIGLCVLWFQFAIPISLKTSLLLFIIPVFSVVIFWVIFIRNDVKFKGFSWKRFKEFVTTIPQEIHLKNLGLAIFRYLIFSHQFYILLYLFDVEISYFSAMMMISSLYVLTSFIPMLFIFDVVVKGSAAIWLFQLIDVSEIVILMVIFSMWIMNFVIPTIAGSYFVMNFSFPYNKAKTAQS